jgi:hypothetical protein
VKKNFTQRAQRGDMMIKSENLIAKGAKNTVDELNASLCGKKSYAKERV